MEACIQKCYIRNGKLAGCREFDPRFLDAGSPVYEVIRVIGGRFLFAEDHYNRFRSSLDLSGFPSPPDPEEFGRFLELLLEANHHADGNVKIVMTDGPGQSPRFFMYYIPHRYPTGAEYSGGVLLKSFRFVREEPNRKVWRSAFRKTVDEQTGKGQVYELLLVNPDGFITEASKANVFFLDGNHLHTPPEDLILQGITRKHVIALCRRLGIDLSIRPIRFEELPGFSGSFITGTSPKILPVRQIDEIKFPVGQEPVRRLMSAYDEVVRKTLAGQA